MNFLFVHDHIFYLDKNTEIYYSPGKLSYEIFQRYTKFCESLIIVARVKIIEDNTFPFDKYKVASGPQVKIIPLKSINNLLNKTIFKTFNNKLIEKHIKDCDLLISRLPSEAGIEATKKAFKHKKPYIVELVGDPFESSWFHGSLLRKLYSPITYMENKRALKKSNFAIYVTSCYLQAKYPTEGKMVNISNVDISPKNDSILKKRQENIKTRKLNSTFKIGMIASLDTKFKGIEEAISVLSRIINEDYLDVSLEIVGGGSRETWINFAKKKNVERNIIFKGLISSRNELDDWFQTIDLYIQPSLTEGLPRSLIEAMSMGLPCIGSNAGGIPELLNKDYIYNKTDNIELKKLILKGINDPSFLSNSSICNFERSKSYYSKILNKNRDEFFIHLIKELNQMKSEK